MIRFYYNPGPNPMKVALFLEEAGLAYEPVPVDTSRGEQFSAEFTALNPNAKVPALVLADGTRLFDSTAILLHLGESTGLFMPEPGGQQRAELLSWMMFVATGIGPYSGQAVHFRHHAPEPKQYAAERYEFEARRHWGVIERHLAGRRRMLGEAYTIVDMAVWGWATRIPFVLGRSRTDEQAWDRLPNLRRLVTEISERPAAARAQALATAHEFAPTGGEEWRRNLFRHVGSGGEAPAGA